MKNGILAYSLSDLLDSIHSRKPFIVLLCKRHIYVYRPTPLGGLPPPAWLAAYSVPYPVIGAVVCGSLREFGEVARPEIPVVS